VVVGYFRAARHGEESGGKRKEQSIGIEKRGVKAARPASARVQSGFVDTPRKPVVAFPTKHEKDSLPHAPARRPSCGAPTSPQARREPFLLKKIELPPRGIETLFGVHDQNIKYLESLLDVRVNARGQDLTVDGDPRDVETVERVLEDFSALFAEGKTFTDKELREAFAQIAEDRAYSLRDYFTKARFNPSGKKQVAPKSATQRRYIEAIQERDCVFGIGPAGTGKTYLAVAMAVQALVQKQVTRIVLARPAVEAGERLGFLPGDLQEKVDPYLRPLYDALFDLMDTERVTKLLEKRVIEVAPLAFMRGRTLADAFIILDEAQNTTGEQMKMFLTRIGFGSKAVITGDVTQIDLPSGKRSGLVEAERILSKVEGIEFVYFTDRDVVRHRLVQMIVRAYEEHASKSNL
jgi:phosphate starvation-inducible PhoH-like protein